MPLQRPSLSTIDERIRADIAAGLPGIDPGLARSITAALARALAGAAHGLYGYEAWIARQLFPDTAQAEFLERLAAIRGLTRKAAAKATGTLDVTGDDGTLIPEGTLFRRSDGVEYQSTADGTISGGTVALSIEAVKAGEDGNANAGAKLSFVSTVTGANSPGTVTAGGCTGGEDSETDEDLRARLLQLWRDPPQGGAEADYVAWAREVSGVSDVWVAGEEMGDGTVTVRFLQDGEVPDAAEITAVADHIETKRPVTAEVFVVAPIEVALDVTFTSLTPNTAEVQAAVTAELQDLIEREREPGVTILLSHIREAISRAAGETDHAISAPSADVAHAAGEIPKLGTVTFP
ncbi:MAG: baseplate J/gp47 family protein [Alphaproteobacteria bacterium]